MKEVKLNFNEIDLVVVSDCRIEIRRGCNTTGLNCYRSELMKFLTDSIDLLMEPNR